MKQEKTWSLIIILLIVLSAWVVLGKHYDAASHQSVPNHPFKYGLDIKGGVRAVLRSKKGALTDQERSQVVLTLENRINGAGVGEATVQPKGDDQFIIEIPDVKNKDAVLQQLGTTAQMAFYYFRDVACQKDESRPVKMSVNRDATGHERYSFLDTRTNQSFRDGGQIKADFTNLLAEGASPRPGATLFAVPAPLSANLPENTPIYFTADQQKRATDLNRELLAWNQLIAASGPPILTGADLEPQSQASLGGNGGAPEPVVSQVFKPAGARAFGEFTSNHVDEIMGIVLDDSVLSAPNINEPIMDGQGQISGGFNTLAEAQSLANLLNAGALPVPLEQVQTQSVEASLGAGAVHKSVIAGLVGLGLVLVFMLLYYRLPGLVADIALLIYALFTIAIFKGGLNWLGLPPVTLTLPGIAGFILSIGMAVDANILIFERLKEELRNGKSLRSSIDAGFKRAFTAIRDSNICTCITCIVLLSLGTASVRGFALTLLIGVLVSLFSAITVTRTLLYLLVDAGIGNDPRFFGLNVRSLVGQTTADDTGARRGMNIIGRRYFFYCLSLAIIVPGLIFWLGLHGLKKSIEFKGGSQLQVRYNAPVTQEQVKKALADAGFKDNLVQMAEDGDVAIASIPETSTAPDKMHNPYYLKMTQALSTLGPDTELSFDNVGGVISAELTERAIEAVIVASVLIVLYLAMVFSIGGFVAGLRLGTSAIIALLHDILVLIGSFAILGYFLNWQIDSLFVTALLTVIGFSVHDTVVIFDRVRENLHHKARGESFEPLVNRSIQQTLARSINTSLTVIMTLLALVFLGGQTTRLLNVALLIGIVSGTYSSIFNAASILVDWENWLARRRAAAGGSPMIAAGSGGSAAITANGGSSRPLPSRPSPRPVATPTGGAKSYDATPPTDGNGADARGIRPKKKRPARRF